MDVERVYTTGVFEEDWPQCGNNPSKIKYLMTLVKITPTRGELVIRFPFAKDEPGAGIYLRENELGTGWYLVANFGEKGPIYLLTLARSVSHARAILGTPREVTSIVARCEKVYNEWVTVR